MTLPAFRLRRRQCASAGLLGRPGKEALHFPLPMTARLGVVDADFELTSQMKSFPAGDLRGLMDYAPEALALPLHSALALADQKLRGAFELPSLKLALVVFSSLNSSGRELLTSHHRDILWKAFGLPLFEQLQGWDGMVIARECEVHDGLHFDTASVSAAVDERELIVTGIPTGFTGEIVSAQCECGVETPRILRLAGRRARAAAA